MNKILSINTIKNVFAALGAKTSDDNYGVALLDKTTAEPKGLMGMSDLASVLGVTKSATYTHTVTTATTTQETLPISVLGISSIEDVMCVFAFVRVGDILHLYVGEDGNGVYLHSQYGLVFQKGFNEVGEYIITAFLK